MVERVRLATGIFDRLEGAVGVEQAALADALQSDGEIVRIKPGMGLQRFDSRFHSSGCAGET